MNVENAHDLNAMWHALNEHAIVSIADLAGNITFANDTFVQISGYSREELMGQNHRILKSDVQSAEFWDSMWKTISSGYVWKGVICNRAKDGTRYWLQAQISPISDANGKIEKYLSIRTDITAHRNALDELELAKSLRAANDALQMRKFYLRATLDNLPFQFWLKDVHGHYLAANQALADACGFNSADEVTGLSDLDLWPMEQARMYQSIDAEVLRSRRIQIREEFDASNSTVRWVEIFIKPLIAGNGALLGTVGYAYDISERKLAQGRLQEHSDHLNAIFDLSPDGFVSFDAARQVSHLSPAFTRMTGITLAQAHQLDESAFSDLLSRNCAETGRFEGLDSLRHRGTPSKPHERARIELTGGNKPILEVELRGGDLGGVSQILYFRDVTVEIEVERLKSDFLATAAHELRTPMVSIYGYSELLLNQELDASLHQECFGEMHAQSKVMVSILDDLLDLARIDERRGRNFTFQAVDVVTLIEATLNNFKPPVGRDAPQWLLTRGEGTILVDARQTQKAIVNVLSNAYKYSPGGGAVQIKLLRLSSATEAPLVGIAISDQGIGMTTAQQACVFERFYRADTSGKILGTGLGMSIVHEIVALHGGRVELNSEPGAGTSVTLWFPEYRSEPVLL
jgi:PAS domain S-box-containing protein